MFESIITVERRCYHLNKSIIILLSLREQVRFSCVIRKSFNYTSLYVISLTVWGNLYLRFRGCAYRLQCNHNLAYSRICAWTSAFLVRIKGNLSTTTTRHCTLSHLQYYVIYIYASGVVPTESAMQSWSRLFSYLCVNKCDSRAK